MPSVNLIPAGTDTASLHEDGTLVFFDAFGGEIEAIMPPHEADTYGRVIFQIMSGMRGVWVLRGAWSDEILLGLRDASPEKSSFVYKRSEHGDISSCKETQKCTRVTEAGSIQLKT